MSTRVEPRQRISRKPAWRRRRRKYSPLTAACVIPFAAENCDCETSCLTASYSVSSPSCHKYFAARSAARFAARSADRFEHRFEHRFEQRFEYRFEHRFEYCFAPWLELQLFVTLRSRHRAGEGVPGDEGRPRCRRTSCFTGPSSDPDFSANFTDFCQLVKATSRLYRNRFLSPKY